MENRLTNSKILPKRQIKKDYFSSEQCYINESKLISSQLKQKQKEN